MGYTASPNWLAERTMAIPVHVQQNESVTGLLSPALAPLFDSSFITSCDLLEAYSARLALQIFQSTGLAAACQQPVTVDEAIVSAGLAASVARVPVGWVLGMLASRGWLSVTQGEPRYCIGAALPALDPSEIAQAQEAHDPRCMPAYRIAALAAEHYPSVLRGQETGEHALFGAEGISVWVKYFSNANPLYAISNAVGAVAMEQVLGHGDAKILELGGGLGSGAEAVLSRLAADERTPRITAYHFTEISPLFLKRAQRALKARYATCPLTFAELDIDRPFASGDVAPGSFSVVYGVNVLHVARDLAATLEEIRLALEPGGAVIISECVRPFAGQPVYLELVFNLLSAFRDPVTVPGWRPVGGFLTPEQWAAALQANGFADVRVMPDIAALRARFPGLVVAAIVARRT